MNSLHLFINRLIEEYKFQYRVIRSIADWTIILYIITPSAAIFFFAYRSWWIESPIWIESISLNMMFLIGSFLALAGNFRTFIQEADKIFLIKNKVLFLNLKNWGFIFSIIIQLVSTVVITVVLLPFFITHFSLSSFEVILYFLLLVAIKFLSMLFKNKIKKIRRKGVCFAVGLLGVIVLGLFLQAAFLLWENGYYVIFIGIVILVGSSSVLLHFPSIRKVNSFDHELAIENEEKLKYISVIYQFSYQIEKTNISTRTKPLVLRNSKRIFQKRTPSKGFIELFVKIFTRNNSYWLSYLQIILVTSSALIIVPPIWLKILILIGFVILMYSWLSLLWEKITRSVVIFADDTIKDSQLSDGKSLLIATSIERLAGDLHITVEIQVEKHIELFKHVSVDEFIISDEMISKMAAQSVLAKGITNIYSQLMSRKLGDDLYQIPINSKWKTYRDAFYDLLEQGATLISNGEELNINRRLDEEIAPGSRLYIICNEETYEKITVDIQ